MGLKRKDLRQYFVRNGLSFYRKYMKNNPLGRRIGQHVLRRNLITVGELQNSAVWTEVGVNQVAVETIDAMNVEANFSITGFHLSPPLNFAVAANLATRPAINVILPSLRRAHMSGGPNTALILASLLAECGERIRLIASDVATEGEEPALFDHMDGLLRRPVNRMLIETVDGYDRRRPINIGPDDIFLATAWWTAQIAKYATAQTVHKAFIYLIQDFEPILHEGSTFHARALETYGLNHVPVINTRLLLDHLLREGAGKYADPAFAEKALWFEPALDRKFYFPELADQAPTAALKPKKVLLFYARPWVARRNLFEMGVVALRQAVASGHIDNDTWEVWAMGEKLSPIDLGNGVFLNPLPWMTFDDYARRVRTADLLLSLMLSPHPSYPPLEMAASGKLVVTNSFSVKSSERMQALSPNILVAEPNAGSIASKLGTAIGRINAGIPSNDPSGEIALPPDWDNSLNGVVDGLMLRVRDMRANPIDSDRPLATGLPAKPDSNYEHYRRDALERRRRDGFYRQEQGLLTLISTVYDTDPMFLDELASSLFLQDGGTQFEWLILDNGSGSDAVRRKLQEIARHTCVRLERVEQNLGIIGGMRYCLERARGRYIMPLDSDDLVDRDCVNVVTRHLRESNYPPALFTDEDKLQDGAFSGPYYKPDWDPVLFLHSCYIAHLCAIDRELALELQCYSDKTAEGCHDWDSFIRLMNAGYKPHHVPHVLYSWRMHQMSTSSNIASKSYIAQSHAATLQRALDYRKASHLRLENSPLFRHGVDWRYRRDRSVPISCATVNIASDLDGDSHSAIIADCPEGLRKFAERISSLSEQFVHLQWTGVVPDDDEGVWDAAGLFELFPDAVMVGGTLHDKGKVVDGPRVFGFGDGCDCPDRGRLLSDAGYAATMWKPRSISAVSSGYCVVRRDFLMQVIPELLAYQVPLHMIGPWLGGLAAEQQLRVLFSPFMAAKAAAAPEELASEPVMAGFLSRFWSQLPETKFYSRHLGLSRDTAYMAVSDQARLQHMRALQQRTLAYEDWLNVEMRVRGRRYPVPGKPATVSISTAVYGGSDLDLLDQLASSINRQTLKASQWLLLVNGPMPEAALATIRQRAASDWAAEVIVEPEAIGIVAALRIGLERSSCDYVIPIDADDLITDDALQIVAHQIEARDNPDFLFSDEDMLVAGRPAAPYLRGAYDSLLSLDNSTIWHLCVMKRETALAAGVYSDVAANWCQDWDSVSRMTFGEARIAHIPEVLYHWRQHSGSTTNNAQGDARSLDSVRHILERQVARCARPEHFEIVDWPESRGSRELYIARKAVDLPQFVWFGDVLADPDLSCDPDAIMVFAGNGVSIQSDSVFVEVARLFEMHPKLGVLGGNVINNDGVIVDGCYARNAAGDLEAPWTGRSMRDAGPFALALKTQQVDLPGGALAFFRIAALREAGLWSLSRDVAGESVVWHLCEGISSARWSAGFSPLIRGRSRGALRLQRAARSAMVSGEVAAGGLIRYGLCRNFRL